MLANLCIVNPASDYTRALAGLHLVKAAYFSGQHTHSQLRGLNVYKKDGPLFKTKPAAAAGPYIYGATLTPRARVMHFQPFKLAGNPFLPLCAAPSERVIHGRAPHPATRRHTDIAMERTEQRVRFHKVELHALGRVYKI